MLIDQVVKVLISLARLKRCCCRLSFALLLKAREASNFLVVVGLQGNRCAFKQVRLEENNTAMRDKAPVAAVASHAIARIDFAAISLAVTVNILKLSARWIAQLSCDGLPDVVVLRFKQPGVED